MACAVGELEVSLFPITWNLASVSFKSLLSCQTHPRPHPLHAGHSADLSLGPASTAGRVT